MLPLVLTGFILVAILFLAGIIGRSDIRLSLSSLVLGVSVVFIMNIMGGGSSFRMM